jgi:hypothetical protein
LSTEYIAPIVVSSTTTLKTKAWKSGWNPSAVESGTYTIDGSVAVPTFIPQPGAYDTPQTVTISCATPEAKIRYTTDESGPTELSTEYVNPITVDETITLKAKAWFADWTPSATALGLYTIEEPCTTPPTQTASPNPPDKSTNRPIDSDLSWSEGNSTCPDMTATYDVYFGTDPSPDDSELLSSNIAEAFWSLGALSYGTTYYWRIDAKDANGTTVGPLWRFTTEELERPLLDEIVAITIDDDTTPSSNGNDNGIVEIGETIELRIAVKNNGSASAQDVIGVLTVSDPDEPCCNITQEEHPYPDIAAGESEWTWDVWDYDFHVECMPPGNDIDFTLALEYTDSDGRPYQTEVSFFVPVNGSPVPPAPALYSPTDGSTIADVTPLFDWESPVYALGYELIVDDGVSVQIHEQNLSSSNYTPSGGLGEGTYDWRVRARNDVGYWGEWSLTWSFTIEEDPYTVYLGSNKTLRAPWDYQACDKWRDPLGTVTSNCYAENAKGYAMAFAVSGPISPGGESGAWVDVGRSFFVDTFSGSSGAQFANITISYYYNGRLQGFGNGYAEATLLAIVEDPWGNRSEAGIFDERITDLDDIVLDDIGSRTIPITLQSGYNYKTYLALLVTARGDLGGGEYLVDFLNPTDEYRSVTITKIHVVFP